MHQGRFEYVAIYEGELDPYLLFTNYVVVTHITVPGWRPLFAVFTSTKDKAKAKVRKVPRNPVMSVVIGKVVCFFSTRQHPSLRQLPTRSELLLLTEVLFNL